MPPVRRGYRDYIVFLKDQAVKEGVDKETAAAMIAATTLLHQNPNGAGDMQQVADFVKKLTNQPSFNQMMEDPETKKLVEEGKGLDLIEKLAKTENARRPGAAEYSRSAELAAEDARFLSAVKRNLQAKEGGNAAGTQGVGIEMKGESYREMMKQIEHAEELAQKGIALSGEDGKKLVNAVKKYNDGATKIPGGKEKSKGYTEAMCIMNRYMPEEEFGNYCRQMGKAHQKDIDPRSYESGRMTGELKTVQQMRNECRVRLQNQFSVENCAALAACKTLEGKGGLISEEDLQKETSRLMNSGSAFSRAMKDNDVQSRVGRAVQSGSSAGKIMKEIQRGVIKHAGKPSAVRTPEPEPEVIRQDPVMQL